MITNPILKGFNPDPCICRVGEDYYIAVSTFEWFPGVRIYHSRDLAHWRLVSRPLNRVSQLDMRGNGDSCGIWAPCLTHHDGLFWLVYTDMKGPVKDGTNYLVTCDRIDGEWSEPVNLGYIGFDPSLFHDDDGRKYISSMTWDPRPGNPRFHGITLREYSHREKKIVGSARVIFKGTDIGITEGPHIYKWNGLYYLLAAEGGTEYFHSATLARSKSIWGDYEVHPANPLISSWHDPRNPLQKAGHGSIVETHTGEWYITFLTGRPIAIDVEDGGVTRHRGYAPLGRETAIQRLEWKDDGWPYVAGGKNVPSMTVQSPDIPETVWENDSPLRYEFNTPDLHHDFQTLRIPFSEEIGSLTERPGHLRLFGRESLYSTHTQAHAARRWQSLDFDAETSVEFNPESFQQMAGLTCYYNTRNWVYACVSRDEEKGRIIDLLTCERGVSARPLDGGQIPVPGFVRSVGLRVEVRGKFFSFLYSFDGGEWTALPGKFMSAKLSDDYIHEPGAFTGAFVGMNCVDIAGSRLPADFDYFSYQET
jgi:xylan 1,4-beta-xylosidase